MTTTKLHPIDIDETSFGSPRSSNNNKENQPLLMDIHSPVGVHGDVVLGLQLNYANQEKVRRRLVDDATKRPLGGDNKKNDGQRKIQQERRERANSFLALSERAVAQGSPTLSLEALQELAKVDGENEILLWSAASAYAKVALFQLENRQNPQACQKAKQDLQIRLRRQWRMLGTFVIVAPPLYALAMLWDQGSRADDPNYAHQVDDMPEPAQIVAMFVSYVVALCLGYHTLRQRDLESKQLVQELYMIASSETTTTTTGAKQEV